MSYPALLIDTSTRHLIIARLEKDGGGLISVKLSAEQGEDGIDCAVAGLFPDLDAIAEIWLGLGPGSFVGLRSSFAYVRMLTMLLKKECRTFLSSRMWRSFFGVAADAWFLMRTNAKLYYAERYTPHEARSPGGGDGALPGQGPAEALRVDVREAEAVDTARAALLGGEKYCFTDSWVPQSQNAVPEVNPPWRALYFKDARLGTEFLTPEILCLSEPVKHTELSPLYGHELNFVLSDKKSLHVPPPEKATLRAQTENTR